MEVSTILIGRENEKKTFNELIGKDVHPRHLLMIVGPAGIGKSYLLHALHAICSENEAVNSFFLDLSPKVAEQNIATLINKLTALPVSDQTDVVDATLAGWEDLPLFSGQPISLIETGKLSKRHYQFNTIAKYINRIGQQRQTVLFIDTDTMNRVETDNLYSFLLEHLTEGTLVVITTRHRFTLTRSLHGELLTHIALEPFTLTETSAYLSTHGISGADLSVDVHKMTKGVPLLITEAIPFILNGELDIERGSEHMHKIIIDRTFTEVEEDRIRELIRVASIMRRFNVEALEKLSGRRKIQPLFDRLRECSFIETDISWITIASPLRESITYEWRAALPSKFVTLNKTALRYYESLSFPPDSQIGNVIHLEIIYHSLCIDEQQGVDIAIRNFAQAESLFHVNLCRSILTLLQQFPFQYVDVVSEWIGYCEATVERLDYQWTDARNTFEGLIAKISSSNIRAHLLFGLSKTLWEIGNWKEAQKTARMASEAFDQLGNKWAKATSSLISGNLLAHQHIWDQSLRQFNGALAILRREHDSLASFQLQLGLAELFRLQGMWDASLEHLNESMSRAEELHSKTLQAQVSHSLGKLHRSRRAWDMAFHYFERSALLREEIADHLGHAQSLHSLGNAHLRANHIEDAYVMLRKSLEIKERIGDKFGIAKSYNGLGHIKRMKGELEDSLEYYRQSLSLFIEVNNHVKASRLMCRIGMTLMDLNKVDEAIEFLEASRDSRQKSNDPQGVAETLYELGLVHERSGEISTARDIFSLSFKFAKNSHSYTRQLAPIVQLVVLAYRDDDAVTGTEHILTARQIAEKNKQHSLLTHLYAETAKAEASANRLTTTLICYAEAVHASVLENHKTTSALLSEIVRFLEQVEALQGLVVAEDFAHNMLVFLQKNSEIPQKQTPIWSQMIPPDVVFVSHGNNTTLTHLKRMELAISSGNQE